MPSPIEHGKLSNIRTGKSFIELHNWMDEERKKPAIRPERHEIVNIPENIKIVKEKFGEEAVREFLYHIKEDYEKNKAYRLTKILSAVKRRIFLPLNMLKNK